MRAHQRGRRRRLPLLGEVYQIAALVVSAGQPGFLNRLTMSGVRATSARLPACSASTRWKPSEQRARRRGRRRLGDGFGNAGFDRLPGLERLGRLLRVGRCNESAPVARAHPPPGQPVERHRDGPAAETERCGQRLRGTPDGWRQPIDNGVQQMPCDTRSAYPLCAELCAIRSWQPMLEPSFRAVPPERARVQGLNHGLPVRRAQSCARSACQGSTVAGFPGTALATVICDRPSLATVKRLCRTQRRCLKELCIAPPWFQTPADLARVRRRPCRARYRTGADDGSEGLAFRAL